MQRPSTAHTRRPQTPTHFDAASKLRPNLYSFDIVDWGDARYRIQYNHYVIKYFLKYLFECKMNSNRDLSLKNNGFVPKNVCSRPVFFF